MPEVPVHVHIEADVRPYVAAMAAARRTTMTGKWSRAYWQDLAERVGSTAIATFIPVYVAASNVAHLDWVNALEVTAGAAGLTLLKGLAVNLGASNSGSASLVGTSSTKKRKG